MMKRIAVLALIFLCFQPVFAQNGVIRGKVFDKETGEPIAYGNVLLDDGAAGAMTDDEGFYNIADVEPGTHTLSFSFIGYDSVGVMVSVKPGQVVTQMLYVPAKSIKIKEAVVSGRRQLAKKKVLVSTVKLTPKQLRALPSTGGEADIAQYLPVLPGVIFSGDQGGQLYIRGGSPIQNLVLLDGVPIYNPFHSIGFFSVFETETIRSVDVLTGGFNAEYGGRISAIVDIKTRTGNKKRHSVTASINPFVAKMLLEGPVSRLKSEKGGSISYMVTGKHALIDRTSPLLYAYVPGGKIPFGFDDVFGKISMVSPQGSNFDFFGFGFRDQVAFDSIASYDWNTVGGGLNFSLIPKSSPTIVKGHLGFSNYHSRTEQAIDDAPRTSGISSFNFDLAFSNYGTKNEINYGLGVNGFRTNFRFRNRFGITIDQQDFNTEINAFAKYKQEIGRLIIEPGFRINFYASLNSFSPELRLGMKYNAADFLRFKLAGGFYSQNLTSTVSERDIVNLFVGFLSGPDETIFKPGSLTEKAPHRLQKSVHAVAGVEIDLSDHLELNVEPYVKQFTQLISLNRSKKSVQEPKFVTETGRAQGLDVLLKYRTNHWYVWTTYSLGFVNRNDGEQVYPTNFDRRHNVNFLATYAFGRNNSWEVSGRWNFGTGFPFTRTQGFYQLLDIGSQGVMLDYLRSNGELGILYASKRNDGRLPAYHRLDLSVKKRVALGRNSHLDITAGVTNVYNRANIFYFDRIQYKRVNQLPILPSVGMVLTL